MRYAVNKSKSARQFRRNTTRTKAANIMAGSARGGWRL